MISRVDVEDGEWRGFGGETETKHESRWMEKRRLKDIREVRKPVPDLCHKMAELRYRVVHPHLCV